MSKVQANERGSALIIVLILGVVLAGLVTSLVSVSVTSSKSAFEANDRIGRLYAAEAGLDRARHLGKTVPNWLTDNADTGTLTIDGAQSFRMGQFDVSIEVVTESGDDYLVRSTATDGVRTMVVGMLARPATDSSTPGAKFFSDYARFVHNGNLNIGSYAQYGGKVHANGNLSVVGKGVVFWDDVTASGRIGLRSDTRVEGDASSYVDEVPLPEQAEFESMIASASMVDTAETTPSGDIPPDTVIHADSPDFYADYVQPVMDSYQNSLPASQRAAFQPITWNSKLSDPASKGATSVDNVDMVFKRDKMDMAITMTDSTDGSTITVTWDSDSGNATVSKSTPGGSTVSYTASGMTKSVPHEEPMYVNSPVNVTGEISRRTSVFTPESISMAGSIKYVDDNGTPLWTLQNKTTGQTADYADVEYQGWSTMGSQWTGFSNEWDYVENPSFVMPTDDQGDDLRPPVLALATSGDMYLTDLPTTGLSGAELEAVEKQNAYREVQAVTFTSGSVIRPNVSGKKPNLLIHGAIITAGTNPVSSFFSLRNYLYDKNLKDNPPPGFDDGEMIIGDQYASEFTNWHIISEN